VEQTDPRRRTSARLAFADHVDYLVAGQRAPGSPKRTEAVAGVNPPLDGPVVLFQDVINILHWSMVAFLLQNTIGFELSNGGRISGVLVGIDDSRRRMVFPVQGFGQKRSAAAASRLAERRKSMVEPVESTAR
jgi:hypothetical protein